MSDDQRYFDPRQNPLLPANLPEFRIAEGERVSLDDGRIPLEPPPLKDVWTRDELRPMFGQIVSGDYRVDDESGRRVNFLVDDDGDMLVDGVRSVNWTMREVAAIVRGSRAVTAAEAARQKAAERARAVDPAFNPLLKTD